MCAFAIAPYEQTKETISQFTDPGKVKNYFSIGLPVIITKVPQIAYEVDKEKCGIAIRYDIQEFTKAVLTLLRDNLKLKQYRKNVLKLRKKYSWDTIFTNALHSSVWKA
jgi:glycosyltransferase involved in cell wall biosynthesis